MKRLRQAGNGTGKVFTAVLVLVFIMTAFVFTGSSHEALAQEYEPEAGDYQSIDGGDWDNTDNWEVYSGTEWVMATDYPGHEPGDYTVTIQSGHEVNENNMGILDFGDLIIYGHLSLSYDLILNNTEHVVIDGQYFDGNDIRTGGAIYWYDSAVLELPVDASLEVRNIKDGVDQVVEGLGLFAPHSANNKMRIRIGDVDYAAATGEGNVVCTFDLINESGGALAAVAVAAPAEFEYDGSVFTTELTGNAIGFGSDPVEATLSFNWTGTGPDSFSYNSSAEDPGEISLDTGNVTHAGQYIFTFTVTSTFIATGAIYSHSNDVVVTVYPAFGELIVTGITGADKEYDGNIDAIIDCSSAELTGVIPGDDLSLDYTGAMAMFDDANAGDSKAISVIGLTLTGSDAGNYSLIPPTVTTDIYPKKLNVTGITGEDKEYDGTTDVNIDISNPELSGVISGDLVSLDDSGAMAAFGDKNVGNSKTIIVTGLTLTGADAGNYTVIPPAVTADIFPRELTATGITGNKEYDGTVGTTINFSGAELAETISGDKVSLDDTGVVATFGDKNVGNDKPVTVIGLILTGADAGNYTLVLPAITADITSRELTVLGITGEDKEYDGTMEAAINLSGAELSGVIPGEDVILDDSGAMAAFGDKNVGIDKLITVVGLILNGADVGNYTLLSSVVTADITPRELNITAIICEDKEYDGTTDAVIDVSSAELAGVLAGDDVSLDDSEIAAVFGDKNVGVDKPVMVTGLVINGADADNYTFIQPDVTADITSRELTITANDCSKDCGDLVSFTGIEFTATGLLGGDTVASVILTCSGVGEDVSVGTYPIISSDAMGTGLENYVINYVDGTLTVNKVSGGGSGGGLAWWVILLIVLAALSVAGITVWYIIRRRRFV